MTGPSDPARPVTGPAPLDGLALARSDLDRAAERRADPTVLVRAWADPATRVLPVLPGADRGGGRVPVAPGNGGALRLGLLPPGGWGDPPEGGGYLLGVDRAGAAYLAVPAAAGAGAPPGTRWAGLREVGPALGDRDAGLAVQALALANWHATHPRCPRCGGPTVPAAAGHERHCPADGSVHHPRTDPAVIMAVTDPAGRLLLGRQRAWAPGRFSTLAGFVEPGESCEQAVRREVHEEAGVPVVSVRYAGSQPWPFPSSLMLGFRAEALAVDPVVDGVELAEAAWFDRERLAGLVATGELRLPPAVSIARRLVEDWFGAPLADPPG